MHSSFPAHAAEVLVPSRYYSSSFLDWIAAATPKARRLYPPSYTYIVRLGPVVRYGGRETSRCLSASGRGIPPSLDIRMAEKNKQMDHCVEYLLIPSMRSGTKSTTSLRQWCCWHDGRASRHRLLSSALANSFGLTN